MSYGGVRPTLCDYFSVYIGVWSYILCLTLFLWMFELVDLCFNYKKNLALPKTILPLIDYV